MGDFYREKVVRCKNCSVKNVGLVTFFLATGELFWHVISDVVDFGEGIRN